MKRHFQDLCGLTALTVLLLVSPGHAQQQPKGAPASQRPVPQSQVQTPQVQAPQVPAAQEQAQPAQAPQPQAPQAEAPAAHAAPIATTEPIEAAAKPGAPVLHEMSPWSMFMAADIVVKAVMLGLAFASLVTWTIFLAKSVELSRARYQLSRALAKIHDVTTLAEAQLALGQKKNVLSAMLAAAIYEARLSTSMSSDEGIKERSASRFTEITRADTRAIRRGTGLLATIGSTAPFVGLFGTVWGIMNSFIGISKSQTTNLAVVAPGIAEALLATAIGLVAAIPAVIIYNHFSRQTRGYLDLVARATGATARLLSRDLDRRHGSGVPAARAAE